MLTHKKASLARNNGEIIIIIIMKMMVYYYYYFYQANGDAGGDFAFAGRVTE